MHSLPLRSVLTPASRGRKQPAGPEEPGVAGALAALEVYNRTQQQQADKSLQILERFADEPHYTEYDAWDVQPQPPPPDPQQEQLAALEEAGVGATHCAYVSKEDDNDIVENVRRRFQETSSQPERPRSQGPVFRGVHPSRDGKTSSKSEVLETKAKSFDFHAAVAPSMPSVPNAYDPAPEADHDFDFTGDGRPYRFARGKASRVRGGKDGLRLATDQLCGREVMEMAETNGTYRHKGPLTPFGGLGVYGVVAQPEVRPHFRDLIVGRLAESLDSGGSWWGRSGLRYTSFGSSECLFDAELLERVRNLGVRISQVCLIDPAYREPSVGVRQALREFADWQRASAVQAKDEPAELLLFGSLRDYVEASEEGGRAAGCHLFVQADAHVEGEVNARRSVLRAMMPGAMIVCLNSENVTGPCGEVETLSAGVWSVTPGRPRTLQPVQSMQLDTCNAALYTTPASVMAQVREQAKKRMSIREQAQARQQERLEDVQREKQNAWIESQLKEKEEKEKAKAQEAAKETPKTAGWSKAELRARARMQARQSTAGQTGAVAAQETPVQVTQVAPPMQESGGADAAAGLRQRAKAQGHRVWQVAFGPHIAVRAAPKKTAKSLGVLYKGEEISGYRIDGWVQVVEGPARAKLPEEAWVLEDTGDASLGPMLKLI